MAVTVVGSTSTLIDTGASPYDMGATHTSSAGSNRGIVMPIVTRDPSAFRTVTGVTWNGTALTKRGSSVQVLDNTATAQRLNLEIWDLLDPVANTAGAISITTSANATILRAHAINIEGSLGPISFDAFGSAVDDTDPGTTAFAANLTTTQPNALVIAAAMQRTVTATVSTWNDGLSQIAISGDTTNAIRLVTASAAQASAGLVNYDGVWDTQDEWGFALAAYYETAGGGGGLPFRAVGAPFDPLIGLVA